MFENEEEKKKREEEAKAIINSVNTSDFSKTLNSVNFANQNNMKINVENEEQQKLIDKINEGNSIINSINPRKEVKITEPTEEELQKSRETTARLINLIDGNTAQNNQQQENENTQVLENQESRLSTDTDIQEDETSRERKERVNVILNGNKPSSMMTKEEKEQEEALKQTALTNAVEANSDKNWFSQIGKALENLWLGAVDGVKSFAYYITDPNHTKQQENELLAGAENNKNVNNMATSLYKAQLNESSNKMLQNSFERNTMLKKDNMTLGNENKIIPTLNENTQKHLDNVAAEYTDAYGQIEINPIQRNLSLSIAKDQEKIASNTNKIDNWFLKKFSELAPSTGNSLVGAGLSMFNPYLGMSYFMISASGSYEFDGRSRGMTKEEARAYGSIMGWAEGASEMVGIDNLFKGGKALAKGQVKTFLKHYGLNMADNAVQEAIIDPIDEFTSNTVSGKTKNDYSTSEGWSQLGQDMIKDGFDGALSALLMDGINAGLNAPTAVYNKIKNNQSVSQQELQKAYKEIQDSGIDINSKFRESFKHEQEKMQNGNGTYSILNTDNEGNIIGIQEANGELIDFNNDKINIVPAVVYNDGYYNIIDAKTGTKLDTTPYDNKQNAISGFNEKISNIDNATINNINNQVTKMQISLTNKMQEIQEKAIANPEALQSQNYIKFANNDRVFNQNDLVSYLTEQERKNQPKIPSQNLRDVIGQIQDKSIYSNKRTNEIMNSIANKFDNVSYTNSKLTVTDNQGNIKYSKDIKTNQPGYTGKTIKNILSNVYNNVMSENNNVNVPQTSSEQNASTFYTNKDNNYTNDTGYAVRDIKKVTQPFDAQETYSKDEMANVWNNSIAQNNYDAYYDKNGNIERYIAIEEEGDNLVVNQYDSNDNIVKSEVIPSENGRYSSKEIKDTIEKVSSLYDENRPIKGQRDIEGNEVLSMKKNKKEAITNRQGLQLPNSESEASNRSISQNNDIIKSIEKFEQAKNKIDRETVVNIANSLDIKIKEGASKIEDTNMSKLAGKNKTPNIITIDELFKDLTSKNIKEYRKEAESIANNLYRDKLVKIYDTQTNTEINKSGIEKTLSGNITKSKIQSINNLQDIIEQGIYGYTTYNPNDNNGILYHHFFTPVNYQNKNGLIRVVIREFTNDNSLNDKYYYHQLEFISNKKIEGINALPQINGNKEIKFLPSTNNSIPQNTKSVKNNTAINKQSMQNNKNNTSKAINSLNDIKAKYKNQTDQLNIFENKDNTISINNLVVKKNLRNKGIGQNILNDIMNYADKNNKTITLTPTSEYLTKSKLTNWYKRNGFVENKGKNMDFSISDTMYRLAKNNTQNKQNIKDDGVRAMKKNKTTVNNNSKSLIAQHNTSEEKLIEALDLGALPVPSIAITKSDTPISNYGDITLLFNQNTINPTDRRNVAYNSDIYSTRRPQTVNSLDKNKTKVFEKSMNDKGINYGYISQIEEYIQNNEFVRAKDTIRYELQKANPAVTEQEIENTFTEAMEIIKDKRILKEGIDPYTPSGNRKTIEQMSVPYTLDNIVRLMTKKSNKGSESNNFAGLSEVRANLSQQFKNIQEMHQQENNLISTEKMQKVKGQLNNEFYNLIDEIGKYDKVERYFGSADVVANALNETAKAKNISKEVLENELDFVSITNVPDKTLQKAIDFLNSLKNAPTEYFEVKPQRAVGLNEIQSAIVPKNTSKELIDKLKENNIPITYYDTELERNKLIANETKNKDIRFAKKTAKPEGEILDPGATNAQREGSYIEQEIRKIEQTGNWDNSIPVTKMTDIRKTIEDYLGLGVQKGHFREQAYGIYKGNRDVIRTKELKDIDTILHETGHALDIGNRINLNKEIISNELLNAVNKYGGYEAERREVQLEEGFAEVIREYAIVPKQAKIDYPQTVSVIEGIMQENTDFNNFIKTVQQQTYNYIHQNPRNRILSNQSIGETTKRTPSNLKQEIMRNVYDKDWAVKSAVNEMQKLSAKTTQDLKASENAYYLTRLASGIGDKVTSMLSKGYIDENGNKLMPGLDSIGELLNNNPDRFNDLRTLLAANRDLDYKAKTLKTGMRTSDAITVREQFKNDIPLQESAKLFYDTLDGVLQYTVNNGLITQENADMIRKSNAFYAPMQRVLEGNRNNVGRKGAVADIIKTRTGSELDIKDVLENAISNSVNMIQQVENNNILKAFYKQGEQAGMTGKIYDIIPPPMKKIGTAQLATWETELRKQGVDTTKIDLEKTIDLFAPNNKVDSNNLITSFINDDGKRVYLQFHDEILFNSLMNMDKTFMSAVLNINRKLNMPLRYGATMANLGFAIPNVISDTAQAALFSEAGFIPVLDNVIGVMDIVSAQNKGAREFFNKIMPGYADRINTLYAIYEQTGATNSTRMSQYRESTQITMKDVYGTKNSEVLGIKEKYKPLKRLLDILTYIPEISEQSTRFRVFEKNLEYYRRNGMAETDARIQAALQSRDATQDFSRTGNITREINQLIPFSAARVGSAYTFAEKVKANPKRVASRMAVLMAISMAIKAIGYDDKEIEELNQRKKDDNFVFKIGDQIITIKKPQGILRSIINLGEYVQDLFTGHIEEGKEGERLVEWVTNSIMDNMPADSVTGLVPNMIAPVVENAINKDLYYNSDIVKSYDLELPDSEQYYDYNSQLAIWLGKIFNYSPAKIDNLISGYFAGLGTSVTNVIDWISGKTGISPEEPDNGLEDNAVGKRFFVNVNTNSQSVDEIYDLKTDLTKKSNGGTITPEEKKQLEAITEAISNISKINKQVKEIKSDLTMSGKEKAEQIDILQRQKIDTARQALGKELLYSENEKAIESTRFYPSRDTLSQNKRTLTLTPEMKKEYEELASEYYSRYEKQGLYSEEKLEQLKSKAKEYAKKSLMKKYRNELVKDE